VPLSAWGECDICEFQSELGLQLEKVFYRRVMLNDQIVAFEYPFWTTCLLKYLIAPQTTLVESVGV
jgi:hypothetical protein